MDDFMDNFMNDYYPELYCPTATVEINKMESDTLVFFYYVIGERYRDVFIREIEDEGEYIYRFYVTPEVVESLNLKKAYNVLAHRAEEIEDVLKDFIAGEYDDWIYDFNNGISVADRIVR